MRNMQDHLWLEGNGLRLLLLVFVFCAALMVHHSIPSTAGAPVSSYFPALPFSKNHRPTIFVAISSYRDAECAQTLSDLFRKAKYPDRLLVGLVAYTKADNKTAAEDCESDQLVEYEQWIRRAKRNYSEGVGSTVARLTASSFYAGQDYILNSDSHMLFAPNWDETLIDMLARCPSQKPVITTYPTSWTDMGSISIPILCNSSWSARGGWLKLHKYINESLPQKLWLTPYAAGGFYFARASLLRDVPFDPTLINCFDGEELLFSARMWTTGYDFFTPDRNLVYHHYGRESSPKFWDDMWGEEYIAIRRKTEAKMWDLLLGRLPRYQYGFGTVRPLDHYYKFAGLDPAAKTSNSASRFCPIH